MRNAIFGILMASLAFGSKAEVTDVSDSGFVSVHILTLAGSPMAVYEALTKNISQWWDANHSYSGKAENFSMDAKAGGCFCEQLDDGGSVEHMRVVYADPGTRLRLLGGLGPLQEMAVTGSMDFSLSETEPGITQLRYQYVVGGYVPGGLQGIADAVDQVQLGQLLRLQNYLTSGSPTDK